jgi:ankyrin repeat protein
MACRHGDLKRCQELISQGVNINGKDRFDYTPLIIVSFGSTCKSTELGTDKSRQVYAVTMSLSGSY